jgi:[ribosomal protein S18]-alanine N-acetyltransferase
LDSHRDTLALNGVRILFLEVEEGNRPALALYARQGFSEVARRTAYYRKADGTTATAIVMRRQL